MNPPCVGILNLADSDHHRLAFAPAEDRYCKIVLLFDLGDLTQWRGEINSCEVQTVVPWVAARPVDVCLCREQCCSNCPSKAFIVLVLHIDDGLLVSKL